MVPPRDQRHLFIGGLHRSGTSLMHAMLRDHPQISGFADTGVPEDEGQHLQTVYPIGLVFGGPGRFGFDPRSFMDERHPLATPENGAQLMAEWGRYWDLTKPVLVEKSPLNLVRARFLEALFQRAYFVQIVRHPVVVAYATRKWCDMPIWMLIEHSLRCYERAMADMPALQHVHVVRYEDLVSLRQRTIRDVLRFVGLDEVPVTREVDRESNTRYFELWRRDREQVIAAGEAQEPGWQARTAARCRALGYALALPEPIAPAS